MKILLHCQIDCKELYFIFSNDFIQICLDYENILKLLLDVENENSYSFLFQVKQTLI